MSLQELVNKLAAGNGLPGETALPADETGAYESADPLLAGLRKNALDAWAHYEALKALRGANDPMTEVASDMADSAQCAYETRLIEARRDRVIRNAALANLRAAQERTEAENRRSADIFRARLTEMQVARTVKDRLAAAREQAEDCFDWTLMMLMLLQNSLTRTRTALSLAQAFAAAHDVRREVAA